MPSSKRTHYKGYLSRADTMARLGVDRDMLATYVRSGRLERIIPPGRKQAYYRLDQVNDLAQELQSFIAVSGRPRAGFSRARTEDMDEAAKRSKGADYMGAVARVHADLLHKRAKKN